MIELQEYKTKDYYAIEDAVEPLTPMVEGFLETAKRGVSATAVENGAVMAVGGVFYTSDTEGVTWLKISSKCLLRPLAWGRAIRETFRLMAESVGDIKISTYILADFCKGEKVARLIGLKKTDQSEEYNGKIYNLYTVI